MTCFSQESEWWSGSGKGMGVKSGESMIMILDIETAGFGTYGQYG